MSDKPKFQFGNVVVVDGDQIGLIVKSWGPGSLEKRHTYDVYVRSRNGVVGFGEREINHFVYSRELSGEEWKKK